jgi:hypothetical protein
MPERRLYRFAVKGGGRFLYDATDVARMTLALAKVNDRRPFTVRPARRLWLRDLRERAVAALTRKAS